jgi:hypothetical protein
MTWFILGGVFVGLIVLAIVFRVQLVDLVKWIIGLFKK